MKTSISNTRAVLTIALSTGFLAVLAVMPLMQATAAEQPKLYLDPLKQVLTLNANINVPIRVNTGGKAANVASITITYPSDLLKFVSISYQGSAFGGLVEESVSTPGKIVLARYATPAGSTVNGDVLFANLTLKLNGAGVSDINLLGGVSQLLSDGVGINVSLGGVNVNVGTKPNTAGPTATTLSTTTQTTPNTSSNKPATKANTNTKTPGSATTDDNTAATTDNTNKSVGQTAATTTVKPESRFKKLLGILATCLGMFGLGASVMYILNARKHGLDLPLANQGSNLAAAGAGGLAAGALAGTSDNEDQTGDEASENLQVSENESGASDTAEPNVNSDEVVSEDASGDSSEATTPIPVVITPTSDEPNASEQGHQDEQTSNEHEGENHEA